MFIFSGANTPFGGSDPVSGANWQFTNGQTGAGALASPYFNNSYYHGDFCNGAGSNCGFGQVPWAGQPGSQGYSESLVVRGVAGVPEPATWALMIGGFGLAGAALRRRRTVAA